jgi:hypothetical protein
MKAPFYAALAACLALSQIAITTASAQEAAHFRTAQAQTFSQQDLQRYGLSSADAAQVAQLQAQGYHVQVMSRDEAQRVYGGDLSTHTWIIIGVVALVVIAVAAAS